MNITSKNIEVFPCTNRSLDESAKVSNALQQSMASEYSLSSIVNKFIDTEGFVISSDLTNGLALNIHGYYFNITPDGVAEIQAEFKSKTSIKKLYAWIAVQELDTTHHFNDIFGQDDAEGTVWYYKGLNITDKIPSVEQDLDEPAKEGILVNGTRVYKLPILERTDTSADFAIKPESRQKFDLGAYGYQTMDGGELHKPV